MRLRPFESSDGDAFFALNTHPLVVESLGSSPTRVESDGFLGRLVDEMAVKGWGMWAVEVVGGAPFVGMVGLHRVNATLPFAPAVEVAWRLHPDWWGHGYATEGALASLHHGFSVAGLSEVVALTSTVNVRSQSVMERIGMKRVANGDFDHPSVPVGSPLRRHVLYGSTP